MKDYSAFYKKHTAFIKDKARGAKVVSLLEKGVTVAIAILYLVGLLLAAFGVFGSYLPTLFRLLVPLAGTFFAVTLLRMLIPRKRPYAREVGAIEPLQKKKTDSNSFPSRHVACAFCIGVCLVPVTLWLSVPVFILGVALAYLRFLCGYHYPSDLLGGAVIGAAIGALAFLLQLPF